MMQLRCIWLAQDQPLHQPAHFSLADTPSAHVPGTFPGPARLPSAATQTVLLRSAVRRTHQPHPGDQRDRNAR